jgi:hypothetical protein
MNGAVVAMSAIGTSLPSASEERLDPSDRPFLTHIGPRRNILSISLAVRPNRMYFTIDADRARHFQIKIIAHRFRLWSELPALVNERI